MKRNKVVKQNQSSKKLLEDINKIVNINELVKLAGDTESNFERSKPAAQQRAAVGNDERRMAERRQMKGSGEKKSAVDTMNDIVNRLGGRQKQEVDTSKLR